MTGRSKRPRLRDVAERSGVSLGTASNAFNRPELLSEALRERVLAEAAALGYGGPDPVARRLRTGRAGALGLIFTDRLPFAFADPTATLFLRGVANGIEATAAGLLVIPATPGEEDGLKVVREAAVDGFLVYSTYRDDPRVAAALDRALPAVIVDEPYDAPTPFIGIDDRAAAREAALHVRGLGHERVAILSFLEHAGDDPRNRFDITHARMAGYRDGLGDAFDPELVGTALPNSPVTGRVLFRELMQTARPPTAVLAMADSLAEGVLHEARELGLAVPGDLSVVGFDDGPQAALTLPPLTTVRQPTERKGELAASMLLEAIEAGGLPEPERTLLPTELVVRGTSGRAPA